MKIEVGEYYLSANCNIVKIIKHNPNIGIFVSNIDILHKSNGRVEDGFVKEFDLIAHTPKQLLNYIVFVTELYHTNNDMKQMVDNNYGFNSNFIYSKMDKNNKKLCNKHSFYNSIENPNGCPICKQESNKALINKFEATNEMLKLATEQIDRLNKAIHIKDIEFNSLEIKEKELSDKIYSLYDNIAEVNKLNTDNYNAWIEEHKTNRKLSIGLTIMSLVIFGLIGTIIGVIA